MKKSKILLLALVLSITAGCFFAIQNKWLKETEREGEYENGEEEKEAGIEKDMMSWFQSRGYPDPYFLNNKYQAAWKQAKKLKELSNSINTRTQAAGSWVSLGPSTGIGGRILSIAINPTKPTSIYVGTAGGGIWKSYNSGTLWLPVTTNFPVIGVPSIVINPSDTMIMYAGTGEVYRMDTTSGMPIPGNTGYNVWKTRGTYGVGILKSINGGTTWTQVFDTTMASLFGVQRLRIDPTNPNIVYAATTIGLYKTINAGGTWTRILNKAYVSDVVINAKNNSQVVVAYGNLQNIDKGVLRSTDGGSTWNAVTGMVGSFQGFIRFDNLPTLGNRDTIIASVGISESPGVNELYRSTDFGNNWSVKTNSTHCQWQYWCAHTVVIKPSNSDSLIYGGVKLRSYKVSTSSTSGTIAIHDDIHDIKVDPVSTNIVYVACDGGMYRSTNGGSSFSSINNGLAATQFYATVGVSPTNLNVIVGGLQDNGVVITNNGGTTWTTYPGNYGDGASCTISPANGNNILSSGDARNVYLSINGGASTSTNGLTYLGGPNDSRTAFNSPLVFSKGKPSIVYVGSDNLHKSTNGGSSFAGGSGVPGASYIEALHKTAVALAVSPTDPNGDTLYASTSPFAQFDNDADGLWVTGQPNILKSTNGGVTLPMTSIKGLLPNRFVLDFAISPTRPDSIFIALGGFGTAHIYVTANGGGTWAPLGPLLPDVPFNTLVFDPINPKIIYAGCDLGVYVSGDRGLTWVDFNNGFWDATQVVDLEITADNKILAATHGKGIFKSDLFTGSTLPVTLTDFSGTNYTAFNELRWTTSQEINLSHYELEKSSNGFQFQKIANITARNSPIQTTYSFNDVISSSASSENYYRLKIVDIDGSYTYSSVIFIKVVAKNKFTIQGNPFNDNIILQYSLTQNQKLTISLFNAAGALLRRDELTATSGSGAYAIHGLDKYSDGIYLLRIDNGNNNQVFKLVKK